MSRQRIDTLSFQIAEYAQKSILYEAILTPKPGLVDAVDSGAHKDMNIYTFIDSSVSLYKGYYLYAQIGLTWEQDEKALFKEIRNIGILVEKDMFKATKNVNTHKGINFSLGIVVAATGYYLNKMRKEQLSHLTSEDTQHILKIVEIMTEGLVKNDFRELDKKDNLTHGEKIYLEKGLSGIRGEVEKGLPTVVNVSLPRLRFLSKNNITKDRLLLDVLFHIMSVPIDSNVINRGGSKALEFVTDVALRIIKEDIIYQDDYQEKIEALNNVFVEKNISPGGSADLLAITIYFALLESIF